MKTHQYRIPDIALRVILDGPAVIYVCKAHGDYAPTFITANIERQLGYTDEEFLSRPGFWIDHIHPDDKDRVLEDLGALFETGHYTHEYRFLHKDGSYRWMQDELTLIRDHTGSPVEIVGYWVDISDRITTLEKYKASEKQISVLFRTLTHIPTAVMITDATGAIVYVNPAFTRLSGYTTEDVLGKNPRLLKSGEIPEAEYQQLWNTISSGKEWHGTMLNRCKDGEPYWALESIFPVKDKNGETTHYVAVLDDKVTPKKQLQLAKDEAWDSTSYKDISDKPSTLYNHNPSDGLDHNQDSIRECELFNGLMSNDCEDTGLSIINLSFSRSKTIYREGITGNFIYMVRSGLVKLEVMLSDGNQKIVRLLSKGDVIGLEILINQPYRHTAIALEGCEVCKIPVALIHDLRTQSAELNYNLMAKWDRNVNYADEWLVKLNTGTARQRVVHFIEYIASISESDQEFTLPSREVMSSILGITRETASRMIADLKREGVITFYGNNTYERNVSK